MNELNLPAVVLILGLVALGLMAVAIIAASIAAVLILRPRRPVAARRPAPPIGGTPRGTKGRPPVTEASVDLDDDPEEAPPNGFPGESDDEGEGLSAAMIAALGDPATAKLHQDREKWWEERRAEGMTEQEIEALERSHAFEVFK